MTGSNSLFRDSCQACSALYWITEVRGIRVQVRNYTPMGHLGKQLPEEGAAGQMVPAAR